MEGAVHWAEALETYAVMRVLRAELARSFAAG